jgi:hypothetical protein
VYEPRPRPLSLRPGDRLELRSATGGLPVSVTVDGATPGAPVTVRAQDRAIPDAAQLVVRWLDGEGIAWQNQAESRRRAGDPQAAELVLGEGWQQVQMRESVRFRTQRVPVACEVQAGSLVPRTRIDLVCLDGSSTGLRAGGVGRVVEVGDVVRLELGDESDPHWVVARVVRVVQLSFGRWEAGFQFMPKTTEERAWLIAWRDSIAIADVPGM